MKAYSFKNHTSVSDFNLCSYAFISDEDDFHFSPDNLTERIPYDTEFPILLNWSVGNETCEEAKKNVTSYACKENSECSSEKGSLGYRCRCSDGYEGNPYLEEGCQDINECERSNMCRDLCNNTLGNYTCSCRPGFDGEGDKRIDGNDCRQKVRDQSKNYIIASSVSVSLLILLIIVFCIFWVVNQRKLKLLKKKYFEQNGGVMLQQQLYERTFGSSVEILRIFTAEELKNATNNYDKTRILGQGGFGTVYKGILPVTEETVAIKKSKICDQGQIKQFINEIIVLSQINHKNVVKLLGCCLETEVPLLVYEFITNGTVWKHIKTDSIEETRILPWEMRLKIAAETADALGYLHYATSLPIIHRDVKTTNILLDESFTAKVADFGASRLMPSDHTHLITLVQGSFGYLDPEYFQTSQLTEKSDVYGYGVVLAELLTSEDAVSLDRPDHERNLAMYFASSVKVGDYLTKTVDKRIVNETNIEQIKEVAKLAERCLRVNGDDRPTMKEITMELDGLIRGYGKHPWMKTNTLFEETQSLLGLENSAINGDHIPASKNVRFDILKGQTMSSFGINMV